jgi:N-acetylneuraminic acid mutarotase
MSRRSLLPTALVLSSLAIAACGEDTTQPNPTTEPNPAAPEFAIAPNSWITRANMPANRTDLAVATMKNAAGQSIVYAIGGRNPNGVPVATVTAYNVATNTWTFRRALPIPLARSNGAGVINGKIYVSSGYRNTSDFPTRALYMYEPATNRWTRKSDIPTAKSVPGDPYSDNYYAMGGGVTGVIGGKLYVVSGCFMSQEPWGYFEDCNPLFFRYNPVTDRWVRLPGPFAGEPTFGPFVGGVISGRFYVMGRGRLEVYDPGTNQWTTRTPLGLPRPGAATAVLDGKLYLMGGIRYNAQTEALDTLAVTIVYDPATNAWTRRASLPSPRSWTAAAKVFLNGQPRIEVVGGIAPGNNVQYIP